MFCMEELARGPQGGEDMHLSRDLERTHLHQNPHLGWTGASGRSFKVRGSLIRDHPSLCDQLSNRISEIPWEKLLPWKSPGQQSPHPLQPSLHMDPQLALLPKRSR